MQYRRFGNMDWPVSALGFGCMRLPVVDRDPTKIDEDVATQMVRHAIDQGVNYVDTAYMYHGGNSERFLGRALQGGYREKVHLATKLPPALVKSPADMDRIFADQLEKLRTDHLDCYLLHGLNGQRWPVLRDLGILRWAEKAKADGRFHHLGFSFHDQLPVFKEIVDAYDGWDFCQIQYNYLNTDEQAGTAGLRYAAARGLGVIVMEPLLGGRLVRAPEPVQALWDAAPQQRSPVEWAFRWLWNQPEVSFTLSGMSTMGHVEENLSYAGAADYDKLSPSDSALIDRVQAAYNSLFVIPCTKCEYCLPCPNELNIPRLLELYNTAKAFNQPGQPRRRYLMMPEKNRASACTACRECEEKCPQQIPVSEWMVKIHAALGEGQPL